MFRSRTLQMMEAVNGINPSVKENIQQNPAIESSSNIRDITDEAEFILIPTDDNLKKLIGPEVIVEGETEQNTLLAEENEYSSPAPSMKQSLDKLLDVSGTDFLNTDIDDGSASNLEAVHQFIFSGSSPVNPWHSSTPQQGTFYNTSKTINTPAVEVNRNETFLPNNNIVQENQAHGSNHLPDRLNVNPESFVVEGCCREVTLVKTKKGSQRAISKTKRNRGEEYISINSKKVVSCKKLKPGCDSRICRRKCFEITDPEREKIFLDFYACGDLQLQREFINRYVKAVPKSTTTTIKKENSRRKNTVVYTLPKNNIDVLVCKKMFLNTISVSDRTVRTALAKKSETGFVEKEKRGGRPRSQAIRDELIKRKISQHIDKFPKVESHYCRASSTRQYLHPDLTISKMYRMFCEENVSLFNSLPSYITYQRIFRSMNLAFHRPKKDQCGLCRNYREGDEETKNRLQEKFNKHSAEKSAVRMKKMYLKEITDDDDYKTVTAVFDLQQVIYLPISNHNALFYKRRLAVYNFTIYNIRTRECHCYVWNESLSKRGSNEIATCIGMYLQYLDEQNVQEVHFFSDGAYGQNKNSIVANMLRLMVSKCQNIRVITLNFFEHHHGQSEGDSAHSTISTALKKAGELYVPAQLVPVFRMARPNNPYIVHYLSSETFLNYKKLSEATRILSVKSDDSGTKVVWPNIQEIMVLKDQDNKMYYKTSHLANEYNSITIPEKRKSSSASSFSNPEKLNKMPIKISAEKYNDLLSLCTGEAPVIREAEYALFYRSLGHVEVTKPKKSQKCGHKK